MSLCTVSFTAFYLLIFLRQASNAHVTPDETLQRHCEWWAAKQRNKSWTVPRDWGLETWPPTDALGWPSPSWSSAVLGKGGACKTCKSGTLSQNILPGKRGGRKMDSRLYIYIYVCIYSKILIVLFQKEKKLIKKIKSNTWIRTLYWRGRQEYPQCVTYLARTAHSLAKKRASLLLQNTACPVRSMYSPKDTQRAWRRWYRASITEMIWLTFELALLGSWCASQHLSYQTEWTNQKQFSDP